MNNRNLLAVSALAAALALLSGCASSPKPAIPTAEAPSDAGEPDLVAQLRERMAAGTLQRQDKPEDKQPSVAADDTSRSPVMAVDAGKQQAVMAVAADYARAMGMMATGQDAEALELLRTISAKAPALSGPLVNQGVILLRQKQYADAETQLLKALEINARNPYGYNLLGIALREQGKFANARSAYESALALDPDYAKAHFNLGVLADLYEQDLPRALTHYERYQALQSKPDPAVANWIIDLQKRTGVYKAPPPAPVPAGQEAPADATPDDTSAPPADGAPTEPSPSPETAAPGTTPGDGA